MIKLRQNMSSKVACVTGANSGIGFCAAKALAERRCTVHMLCRDKARGEEARARLSAETGNEEVHLHVVDVSDFRQVGGSVERSRVGICCSLSFGLIFGLVAWL